MKMELHELQQLRTEINRPLCTMISNDDESIAHDDIINNLSRAQSILDTLIEAIEYPKTTSDHHDQMNTQLEEEEEGDWCDECDGYVVNCRHIIESKQ